MKEVTDPAILAQLNAPSKGTKEVTNPGLLSQLNAPPSPLDRLPPEVSPGGQPVRNTEGIGQRILGAGEAGLSAVTGALGGAAGQLYGIGKTLTGGKYGTLQGAQEGEAAGVNLANRLTYQPRTQTGQQLTEAAGRALEASRLQGLPPELMPRIPEIPSSALRAGEAASAAGKVGAQATSKAAIKAVAKAFPEVDEETAQLARRAYDMGFRLTPEQVAGGKYGKMAGESLANVPLSGSNMKANLDTFTRNVAEKAGVEGGKLTHKAYDTGLKKWGSQIEDISVKYPVQIDNAFINEIRSNAAGKLPEVQSVVNYYAELIDKSAGKRKVLPGGGTTAAPRSMSGTTVRQLKTKLDRQIEETTNGDLKRALTDIREDLLDAQEHGMYDKDKAAMDTARGHYHVLKLIEPLVAKSPTGDVLPSALIGVLTSTKAGKARAARGAYGDLGDLAAIGQRFLKEPASSGTAERSFIQQIPAALAGLAGVGAAGAAGTAAAGAPGLAAAVGGTYGAANLYNRFGPAVTQQMISRPPQ